MEMRTHGNSGLRATPLALGGNVFGWTADEATSFRVLDAFVAAGFTAPIASATSVERLRDLLDATRLELDPAAVAELTEAST